MTRAVNMLGLLAGAAVFGSVADHFGRKLSLFMSVGVMVRALDFRLQTCLL